MLITQVGEVRLEEEEEEEEEEDRGPLLRLDWGVGRYRCRGGWVGG